MNNQYHDLRMQHLYMASYVLDILRRNDLPQEARVHLESALWHMKYARAIEIPNYSLPGAYACLHASLNYNKPVSTSQDQVSRILDLIKEPYDALENLRDTIVDIKAAVERASIGLREVRADLVDMVEDMTEAEAVEKPPYSTSTLPLGIPIILCPKCEKDWMIDVQATRLGIASSEFVRRIRQRRMCPNCVAEDWIIDNFNREVDDG